MLNFIPTVLVILSSKFYEPVTNRDSFIKWLNFEYFHYEVNATSCNDDLQNKFSPQNMARWNVYFNQTRLSISIPLTLNKSWFLFTFLQL